MWPRSGRRSLPLHLKKTRYANEWIIELQRESVVQTGELAGELVVRLRSDAPVFEMALAMN